MRPPGLATQGFHTAIPARLSEVDVRPAFVVFSAGVQTLYFVAYFIRDCRYTISCVIRLLMKDMVPFVKLLCGNSTLPHQVVSFFFLILLSNIYCNPTGE